MYNSVWYNNLIRPFLAPPSYIFTPVWIVLYLSIIIALILYITSFSIKDKKIGYIFFTIQLILNLIWSPIFFGMQNILLALIIILLMDVFLVLTIKKFYSISKLSGLILIPYLIWILFATYLNIGYFVLN
jgi:tryptophan-rich sensory protein